MNLPIGQRTKNKRAVDEAVKRLRAKCRRIVLARLRDIERQAASSYVAFRLDRKPSEVRELLYGKGELTIDDLSDLGIAVGIEFNFSLKPKRKAKVT